MAKKGLGRGLNALLRTDEPSEHSDSLITPKEKHGSHTDGKEETAKPFSLININLIEPNRKQPRKKFDAEKLEALADSIREHGLIQPILVTHDENGRYTIIAGERRWRASKKAGLTEIPAIVRDYPEIEAAQIALIENLQREDLNPIEEAAGYRSLIDEYSLTQEEISKRLGKSRSAIANSLRLLSLGDTISALLIDGSLSTGHARALLGLEDEDIRNAAAETVINEGLNVRQTEQLVKKLTKNKPKKDKTPVNEEFMVQLNKIADSLCSRLGTKVNISHGEKKGRIEIEYYGNEDLDRILSLLNVM
ncbi:MAG: ParB/RepB/Spo0J family partition protein [bacterium]|nr:ParB/RepB/Spo0J family partition protein [bacterium]